MKPERRYKGMLQVKRVLRIRRMTTVAWYLDLYDDDSAIARRMLSTRQSCSCVGCGNQRQWEGGTRQERRADDEMEVQLSDLTQRNGEERDEYIRGYV
jgi:hypothetical protein